MRRIILFRHGKSSWSDPDQEDLDRPLNGRGRAAAALMGAWLDEVEMKAPLVLLSPAVRARETWTRAARNLSKKIKVEEEKALYMADPKTMLELVQGAPKRVRTLILVGHQPGMSAFARKMTGGDAPSGCARAFEKFPTAAVAILDLKAKSWEGAEYGGADFTDFAAPKDIV